jgi:hypothetical protein
MIRNLAFIELRKNVLQILDVLRWEVSSSKESLLAPNLFGESQIKRQTALEGPRRTRLLVPLALWRLVYSGSPNRHLRSARP